MSGKDVKRQVQDGARPFTALRPGRSWSSFQQVAPLREAMTALAPCVVLTPEEWEKVLEALRRWPRGHMRRPDELCDEALALLSPDPGDLPHDPPLNEDGC